MDADSKLCISYLVGLRDGEWAAQFVRDVASRLESRIQLTTDGYKAYIDAVDQAFHGNVDYAMLVKVYGATTETEQRRYSPAAQANTTLSTNRTFLRSSTGTEQDQ